MTLGCTGVDSV